MATEIGESLFYSWLRHVQMCQIVQTNWKPSPLWRVRNENKIRDIVQSLKNQFNTPKSLVSVLDRLADNLETSLLGSEVDVIGVATDLLMSNEIMNNSSKPTDKIYTVDVAFHSNGLHYNKDGQNNSITKVLSKFIRTALCIIAFFDRYDAELCFAAPKIRKADQQNLNLNIKVLESVFNNHGCSFVFRIISNEDFKKEVTSLIEISKNVNDQSELFLRSCRMLDMFDEIYSTNKEKKHNKKNIVPTEDSQTYNLRPGELAKLIIPILTSGTISNNEILLLQDKEECRRIFNFSGFPVIVKEDAVFDDSRYYKKSFEVDGTKYRLCSQWYERNRKKLLDWLNSHK
ncbi:MAG: hypothetical protein IKP33_08980 [Prevotella sp.]|nr:hypothetical protein [Prevotella sp.]